MKAIKTIKTIRLIGFILILVNMAVLTKYILFKHPADTIHVLKNTGKYLRPQVRHSQRQNLVLFASIRKIFYSRMDDKYKFMNIGGNILGFIPLGYLLPLVFFRRWRLILTVATIFLTSLLFESVQLYTGLGVFDVDDLLLNTIGGLLGCMVFLLIFPPFGGKKQHQQLLNTTCFHQPKHSECGLA